MSRATRVDFEGAPYHVISRGVARMAVYLAGEGRRSFLAGAGRLVSDGALIVHAFCLMPIHYHLLCQTPRAGWLGA